MGVGLVQYVTLLSLSQRWSPSYDAAGSSETSLLLGFKGGKEGGTHNPHANGGVVFLELKKINLILGSSMLTEGHGRLKLSDRTLPRAPPA